MSTAEQTRRQFLSTVGTATAAVVLAACAPKETIVKETVIIEGTPQVVEKTVVATPVPGEPVKIVVSAHWALKTSNGWSGLVQEFVRRYPNVTVEAQEIPYGDYDVKILTQVAAGTVPDAMAVAFNFQYQFVDKGVIVALDPFMDKFGVSASEWPERYMAERTFDGKVYAIPKDMQPECVVFYNKALFAEAGVQAPQDPYDYSWQDLRAMAQKLTKTGADGKVSQYGLTMHNWLDHVLHAYTGGYVDNPEAPTKCLLGTPEAIEGLQLELDMIYKDQSIPSPAGLGEMGTWAMPFFGSGKAAMWPVNWSPIVYGSDTFKEIDMSAFLMPSRPKKAYGIGNTAFGVASASKHQEVAAEFIFLMLRKEGWLLEMADAKGNVFAPAHKEAFAEWLKWPEGPCKEARGICAIGAEYGVFAPRHPRWSEISSKYIGPDWDLVLRQQKPLAETMQAVAKKVDEELAKG